VQTTAYHPELNGAVEKLHRRLKDALRACAAAATWTEELPFVLLGLRAQLREDTGLSPAESVFVAPIVLPNELLQCDEVAVDSIIRNFQKTLDAPAFSLPRHNSSSSLHLPSELPAQLLSARLVWIPRGGAVRPLHPLYDGPFAIIRRGASPEHFRSGTERRSSPSAACLHGRRSHAWQSAPPRLTAGRAPRRLRSGQAGVVWAAIGLYAFIGTAVKWSRNRFPTQHGGFCMPGTGGAVTVSTAAESATPQDTPADVRFELRDLT
jgi:hypothetical protein